MLEELNLPSDYGFLKPPDNHRDWHRLRWNDTGKVVWVSDQELSMIEKIENEVFKKE